MYNNDPKTSKLLVAGGYHPQIPLGTYSAPPGPIADGREGAVPAAKYHPALSISGHATKGLVAYCPSEPAYVTDFD